MLQVPQSHKKGVTCISGIMVSQTEAVFASTSSDGTVCVWELVLPLTSKGKRLFPMTLTPFIVVLVLVYIY